jgi:hypothetical protein
MNGVAIVLLFLFIVLLFVVLFIVHKRKTTEWMDPLNGQIKVFQCNSEFDNLRKSDSPSSPFREILDEHGYEVVQSFSDANLILFTDYSFIDQKLPGLPFNKWRKYLVYGVQGSDQMASKSNLAIYLKKSGYESLLLKSFVLDDKADMKELISHHQKGNIYILKKNVQRQEGNLITDDVDFITERSAADGFVVCQELLQNPFLVNKRKINLRVYMLVVVRKEHVEFYIYKNGFMYYTPKYFEKNSLERDTNITTGYIDRQVYKENPLTLQGFNEYLGDDKSKLLWKNMIKMFKALKVTYDGVLLNQKKFANVTQFNIYGVDVAPDENLNTQIIEINKGPDLTYKDERDKAVKLNMMYDCFTMLEITNKGDASNFMKL